MSQSAKENLIKGAVAKPLLGSSSEERCRKAFEEWMGGTVFTEADPLTREFMRRTWNACWKYLESRVTDFIQE